MLVLPDPTDLDQVKDGYVRALLARRFNEMAQEDFTFEELGEFLLIEPGDTVAAIEDQGRIWVTRSPFNDVRYGEAGFAPCFETLEAHPGHCFEMVHILNDSGYGVIVIVPDKPGMDDELLRFCREYATPTPDVIAA
ncbi:hypothetical protein [Propionivibrio sp.]|uniref:hypothetical protein n=1 Tax=Propionivibrio sp. TaxID=2212460 RepID=UPI003BF29F4F